MASNKFTFLVFADLHGRIPKVLSDEKFDAIICPGDICLDNLRQRMFLDEDDVDSTYFKLKEESYQKGREILELLNSFEVPVYLVPGNWDPTKYCDGILREDYDIWKEELIKNLEHIYDCEFRRIENELFQVIGYGSTSAPEILQKEEVEFKLHQLEMSELNPEEYIEEEHELLSRHRYQKRAYEQLDELFNTKEKEKLTIYISHNSPYKTPLDKIDNINSSVHGEHYGSIISRDIIEKYQPELVISGHIHEGVGVCKIKESICLNSGFGNKINHIVTIDIDSRKVLEIKKIGSNSKE